MTDSDLTSISFFSEPGVYEIETEGVTYDVTVPEELTDPGSLLVSKTAGAADELDGRDVLRVVDFGAELGESAFFIILLDDDFKEVKTKTVKTIVKVS